MPRLTRSFRATRAKLATNHSEAKVFAINFPKLTGCSDKHPCSSPGRMLANPFLSGKYFVKNFTNLRERNALDVMVRQKLVGVWLRVSGEPADDLAKGHRKMATETTILNGALTGTQAGSGTPTILLVEDDPSVRGLVSRLLTLQGYKVLVAEHGRAALPIW